MTTLYDDHGHPLTRNFSAKRIEDRGIDEMIGICKGLLADGSVSFPEAKFFLRWMETNLPYNQDKIVNMLYCRIREMLIDGVLDAEEQRELVVLLTDLTGESAVEHGENFSTSLPLCNPPPPVIFPDKLFCLTGKFAYATRPVCESVVLDLGGKVASGVSNKLDYLVIGTFSSRDWIHTSYGRKIEAAVDHRASEGRLSIISEDVWARAAFE